MVIRLTDGRDADFAALCGQLDAYLNQIVGEESRAKIVPYNTLANIHDVWVAYQDDKPVACASFRRLSPDTAEIKRVFTCPDYRGRGTGRQLISMLENRAAEQGYTHLVLETSALLVKTAEFYNRLGYGRIENYGPYAGMEECICMGKEILPNSAAD